MYLIENHHEAIIDRKTFDAAQTERARRNAGRSPSKKYAPTGKSCYASKYALSERLVCGECGTLYRRCTWAKRGRKRVVWRCVSRLDYGTKYCHDSPTLDEAPLQRAILAAINSAMSRKSALIRQITGAMEQASAEISEWEEALIRQLVDTVKVVSAEKIIVYLRGGIEIEQNMTKTKQSNKE